MADASPLVVTPPTGRLSLGVAFDAMAADPWENPTAVRSARRVLAAQPLLEAQNIMGWGATNPEPTPGIYDWTSLDERIALIQATGGTPVITLAGAPDWMTAGVPGRTDWAALGQAPTPSHYSEFAELAAAVARRYPDVRYFQVWKEMAGFWDSTTQRWNIQNYTEMYNDVYRALKAVNPAIEVGGPYIALTSWAGDDPSPDGVSGTWGTVDPRGLAAIDYWLRHKAGADFIAVDTDTYPRAGIPPTDEFTATEKLAAIDRWLSQRTDLPIWWSEFYVQPTEANWTPAHQAAVMTAAIAIMASSGASVALVWGPEEEGDGSHRPYLWTEATSATGGQPSPLAASVARFVRAFGRAGSPGPGAQVMLDRQPPYQIRYSR